MTSEECISGWRAITIGNDRLQFTVLPEKGAEIWSLVDVASGVDVLFKAPWGLAPPGATPRDGWDGRAFLANYAGGWQELFPNVGDACAVGGVEIPFHGEVATLAWDEDVLADEVHLAVSCERTPFRLERTMRLDENTLVIRGTVTNESDHPARFVWGHHCVLGRPFLEEGCTFNCPATTIVTIPEMWEETARLEPGQSSGWPYARSRSGGVVDLRDIPGPDAESHDDAYLTGLAGGWAEVLNKRLELGFRLEWDASVLRSITSWQVYGGARAMPLAGSYALGVEPWVSRFGLERAIDAGEAIELAGRASLSTTVTASIRNLR